MTTPLDLSRAGPLPAALAEGLAGIEADLAKGQLDAAERAAVGLLEADPAQPHLFLLLSQLAAQRGDAAASLDFLRNASLLAGAQVDLLADALAGLVDAGRVEDARDLVAHFTGRDALGDVFAALEKRVAKRDVLAKVMGLAGLAPPVGGLPGTPAVPPPPQPLAITGSFDSYERGMGELEAPPAERGEGPGGEPAALDATALEHPTLAEEEPSLVPPPSPLANTPNHFLAQKTACPGLDRYLQPLAPTWNVPRSAHLLSQASAAIIKSLDFLEAMHFRGMWPQSFNVSGLKAPDAGHEERPKDFRWELAEPGFARVILADVLAGYEATRHVVALKHAVRAAKALAAHQHRLGGWASHYNVHRQLGRGTPNSFPPNAVWLGQDGTTTTLCLLISISQQVEVPMVTTAAMRAVQAIMHSQNPDGSWPMVWVEQERVRADLDRHYGRACLLQHTVDNAMRALALARYALQRVDVIPCMVAATQWLLRHQAAGRIPGWLASYDAGGLPGPHGAHLSLSATLAAMDALCFGACVTDTAPAVEAARKALHWVETFERAPAPLPDFFDAATGQPVSGAEKVWTPARLQRVIPYIRRRLLEDCMGQTPVPEKILRSRILHDAEELCGLVAAIIQHQHPSGLWPDASGRAVLASSYVWTLAQFILMEQAGTGQAPLAGGRKTHWQDFLLPDRQWLTVSRESRMV